MPIAAANDAGNTSLQVCFTSVLVVPAQSLVLRAVPTALQLMLVSSAAQSQRIMRKGTQFLAKLLWHGVRDGVALEHQTIHATLHHTQHHGKQCNLCSRFLLRTLEHIIEEKISATTFGKACLGTGGPRGPPDPREWWK